MDLRGLSFDVIVPTKNNEVTIGACLDSVRREIPVHCLINVDANSSDRTRTIVKEKFPDAVQIFSDAHIGKAREISVDRVDTKLFVFVDSDCELLPGWLKNASAFFGENVGAVEGLWSYIDEPWVEIYSAAMKRFAHILRRKSSIEMLTRAFTGDVLVLTAAARGIQIPNVRFYEDDYLRLRIEDRGFRWLRTPQPLCLHHTHYKVDQVREEAETAYQFGRLSVAQAARTMALSIPKALFAMMLGGHPEIMKKRLQIDAGILTGTLKAKFSAPAFTTAPQLKPRRSN